MKDILIYTLDRQKDEQQTSWSTSSTSTRSSSCPPPSAPLYVEMVVSLLWIPPNPLSQEMELLGDVFCSKQRKNALSSQCHCHSKSLTLECAMHTVHQWHFPHRANNRQIGLSSLVNLQLQPELKQSFLSEAMQLQVEWFISIVGWNISIRCKKFQRIDLYQLRVRWNFFVEWRRANCLAVHPQQRHMDRLPCNDNDKDKYRDKDKGLHLAVHLQRLRSF